MRSSQAGFAAGCLLGLAVLAGCRTVPPAIAAPATSWEVRRPEMQALTHYALKGRVAVATGSTGFNANLRWTQEGDHAHLALEGPLGVGGVQVIASGNSLEVITAHGEHIDNDAARAELRNRLGFDVPIESLRYWVLGVPQPGLAAEESLDPAQQRLSSLVQGGWHIEYLAYTAAHGQTLPARLTLERETVRVRLLVDDWQL
jgi:outer membrane lipoprotein LolB